MRCSFCVALALLLWSLSAVVKSWLRHDEDNMLFVNTNYWWTRPILFPVLGAISVSIAVGGRDSGLLWDE